MVREVLAWAEDGKRLRKKGRKRGRGEGKRGAGRRGRGVNDIYQVGKEAELWVEHTQCSDRCFPDSSPNLGTLSSVTCISHEKDSLVKWILAIQGCSSVCYWKILTAKAGRWEDGWGKSRLSRPWIQKKLPIPLGDGDHTLEKVFPTGQPNVPLCFSLHKTHDQPSSDQGCPVRNGVWSSRN